MREKTAHGVGKEGKGEHFSGMGASADMKENIFCRQTNDVLSLFTAVFLGSYKFIDRGYRVANQPTAPVTD